MKFNLKKIGLASLSSILLLAPLTNMASSVVNADSVNSDGTQTFKVVIPKNMPTQNKETSLNEIKSSLKKQYNFSNEDLEELSDSDILALKNYVVPNSYSYLNESKISASAVAKAVLKGWHKLPKSVKKAIIKRCGSLSAILKTIEHFTGTEDHIVYSTLRHFGVSKSQARIWTKIITWVSPI